MIHSNIITFLVSPFASHSSNSSIIIYYFFASFINHSLLSMPYSSYIFSLSSLCIMYLLHFSSSSLHTCVKGWGKVWIPPLSSQEHICRQTSPCVYVYPLVWNLMCTSALGQWLYKYEHQIHQYEYTKLFPSSNMMYLFTNLLLWS